MMALWTKGSTSPPSQVAASTHKGEEAAEAVKTESATLTLEPHDPPVGDAPASSLVSPPQRRLRRASQGWVGGWRRG